MSNYNRDRDRFFSIFDHENDHELGRVCNRPDPEWETVLGFAV